MFRKKLETYHAAAGEMYRYREQTARLHAHRVSSISYTSYAVAHPKGNFASDRAEDSLLFHTTFARCANVVWKRSKHTMLPQANRASIWANVQFGSQPRNSCELHELRSRIFSDGIRLRQGGIGHPFWRKCCTMCNISAKKIQNVPRCRRRIGVSLGQTPGLNTHHVRRVTYTTYAVGSNPGMCLHKRPDSPPAGRKIPCFFTNMLHTVQHVCETRSSGRYPSRPATDY